MRPLLLPGPAPTQSELAPRQRSEEPRPTTARHGVLGPLWGLDACWCVWAEPTRPGGDAARRLPLRTTPLPEASCPSHRAALPLVSVDGGIRHPNSGKGPGGRATLTRGAGLTHQPQPAQGFSGHCMDHPSDSGCRPHPTHPQPTRGFSGPLHGPPLRFGVQASTPPQPSQGCPSGLPLTHLSAPVHGPALGHALPGRPSPPIGTLGSSAATVEHGAPPRVHRPLFSPLFQVLRKPQSRALAPKARAALALDLTR